MDKFHFQKLESFKIQFLKPFLISKNGLILYFYQSQTFSQRKK